MKLYVHWDGDQPFTKVVRIDDKETVSFLRDACWEILKAQRPELTSIGPGSLRLTSANRRHLSITCQLADVLSNGDDVFYQISASAQAAGTVPTPVAQEKTSDSISRRDALTSLAAATTPSFAAHSLIPPAAPTRSVKHDTSRAAEAITPASSKKVLVASPTLSTPSSSDGLTLTGAETKHGDYSISRATISKSNEALVPVVRALWLRAEELEAQQLYRAAGDALQQVLLLVPEPSRPTHIDTLLRLARLWLAAGNPGVAVQWALRAANQRPDDPEVLELAGDCLRKGGRPYEAAMQYRSALEMFHEEGEEDGWGLEAVCRGASPPVLRLRLSLAACLATLPGSLMSPYNNQDLAASLVMAVLERNPNHWDAQFLYARMALDRGLRKDALMVALRLVVGQPKQKEAKALLAECLADEASWRVLYEELRVDPSGQQSGTASTDLNATSSSSGGRRGSGGGNNNNASNAAALAFVAIAVKDFGKVDACIELLKCATQLDPANASYCLNLIHALELRQELQAALEAGRRYCRLCGTELAGRPMKDMDALLANLPQLHGPLQLTWYASEPLWGQEGGPRLQPDPRQDQESAPGRPLEGCRSGDEGDAGCNGSGGGDQAKVTYSSEQMDELAILFALSKVLYVGGALATVAKLCEVVEPLRRASAVELHTTLIRNEAAYFGCIAQLLKEYPPPPARPAVPDEPLATTAGAAAASEGDTSGSNNHPTPLYLCGDSHCLSAAWRLVTLRGEQRLLRPILVTGCKVWHLRPASEFYPKKQFEASLRLLPDGAQVILVLGEIDCREGLLVAVQKGKYVSVAEGIEATVAIYIDVLRRMVLERSMEVFVHPVPPVLNETRAFVVPFSAALSKAVAAARQEDPVLRERLHYLDFFDQLLVPRQPAPPPPQQQQQGGSTEPAADAAASSTHNGTASSGSTPTSTEGPGTKSEPVKLALDPTAAVATVASVAMAGNGPIVESSADAGCVGDVAGKQQHAGGIGGSEAVKTVNPAAAAPSGWALRPNLAFDGTHIAPTYVPLLNAAISEVQ